MDGAAGDTTDLTITGSDLGTVRVGHLDRDRRRRVGDRHREPGHRDDLLRGNGGPGRGVRYGQHRVLQFADRLQPRGRVHPGQGGQGGSYQVPATPVPVTCTVTNTRTSTSLILQKTWVNGAHRRHRGPGHRRRDDRPGIRHRDRPGERERAVHRQGDRHRAVRRHGRAGRDPGRREHRRVHLAARLRPTGPDPSRRRARRYLPGSRHSGPRQLHLHQHRPAVGSDGDQDGHRDDPERGRQLDDRLRRRRHQRRDRRKDAVHPDG